MFRNSTSIGLLFAVSIIAAAASTLFAAELGTELDAAARRQIQDAKMMKWGTGAAQRQGQNSYPPQQSATASPSQSGVTIVNAPRNKTSGTQGSKGIVSVGQVIQTTRYKGVKQENVTVVVGDIINVVQ